MSADTDTSGDPIMLVITDLLKPGQLKIARITRSVTLPRLIPVVTLAFTAVGLFFGLIFGLIFRIFLFESLEVIFIFGALGAATGYGFATIRLDGQEIWKWAALRFSAASKARTRINNSPTRIIVIGVDDPPPDDGILVASNVASNVYAVASKIGKTGRVYAGIAPMPNLILGEVTVLSSTVPVKKKRLTHEIV
jgi:hypothetical protein